VWVNRPSQNAISPDHIGWQVKGGIYGRMGTKK
jgi:hypothetical protein